jgi:hypothetical protein
MKGLSQESRALIDAARDGDNPTVSDRRRVRAALGRKLAMGAAAGAAAVTATHTAAGSMAAGTGAATSAGAGAGTTAAAAGAGVAASAGAGAGTSIAAGAFASGLGAKLVVSVAIVSALGAGTVSYVKRQAAPRDVPASSVALAPSAPAPALASSNRPRQIGGTVGLSAASRPAPMATVAAAAPDDTAPAPPAANDSPLAHAPSPAPPSALPSSSAPAAPASDLNAELALLQEVHVALKGGDGARALALLDEHDRRFPNGQLGEESQAARVFALCTLGRVGNAREMASRFLRQHAHSPLAARVARACDAEAAPF